jgi:hypothetical protein
VNLKALDYFLATIESGGGLDYHTARLDIKQCARKVARVLQSAVNIKKWMRIRGQAKQDRLKDPVWWSKISDVTAVLATSAIQPTSIQWNGQIVGGV